MPRYVIVGGGLAGSLLALALGRADRGARVTVLERATALDGAHTWSFHDGDLDGEGHQLIDSLVTHRWPGYRVRFPSYERSIGCGYATVSGATFARLMPAELAAHGVSLRLGARVTDIGLSHVTLQDGSVVEGDVIVDARGPASVPPRARAGYQKFVGLEVDLATDGPWTAPLLMDATVPQQGGYRFIYVLPFSARRVLIEDTIYAGAPDLDVEASVRAIQHYALRAGAKIGAVRRRETGVLPLPITDGGGRADGLLAAGYRGGFFHPVTGYALPLAVRLAVALSKARTAAEAHAAVADLTRALRPQDRFGRLLNRLLFDGLPAAARRGAFERFYRLPEPTIARFYASRSTVGDRARVLLGRPPAGISWGRLLGAHTHRTQGELS